MRFLPNNPHKWCFLILLLTSIFGFSGWILPQVGWRNVGTIEMKCYHHIKNPPEFITVQMRGDFGKVIQLATMKGICIPRRETPQ